jgi:hypothetical protein
MKGVILYLPFVVNPCEISLYNQKHYIILKIRLLLQAVDGLQMERATRVNSKKRFTIKEKERRRRRFKREEEMTKRF